MKKRKGFQLNSEQNKEQMTGILFLLPFGIFFTVFTIFPVFSSMVTSFFNYDMLTPMKWVGVNNYLRMILTDDIFQIALRNTLIFAFITGPLGFALSFLLAWLINEFNKNTRNLLAFLFYSPSLVGNVYFVWTIIFSGDSSGYLNSMLLSLGVITEPIQFLKDADYTMIICIIVQLWLSMGTSFLANIAGLQNASPQLYEAGAIDGIRNRWQELWYITLPSMKNILLFSSVMQIQSAFSAGAVMTALTGNPSVEYSTHTIVTHLTDVGTVRFEMGYASAISCFLFILMAISRWLIGKLLSTMGK